jgi:hypothetical protein
MRAISKSRAILAVAALGLLAVALVAPQAGVAKPVPSLVSTPQYEEFAEVVSELRQMTGKPHTPQEKAAFESKLTRKHRATVNRANSLFRQSRNISGGEIKARFKRAAKKVRKAEAVELADLRAEYADRMGRATHSYVVNTAALADRFDRLNASVQRQVRTLQTRKAKAKSLLRKDQIQAQINHLTQQLDDSHRAEREASDRLQQRYSKQKQAIRTAKAADTAEVTDSRQDALENLRSRAKRSFDAKVAELQSRRTNQVSNLDGKLAGGRAAIASMPDLS